MNHGIPLTPRYRIHEVNNQNNYMYVDMRLINVNKKNDYVDII